VEGTESTDWKRGCAEILASGSKVALFAIGSMVETAWEVRKQLKDHGISATVVNARFAVPFGQSVHPQSGEVS